LTNIFEVLYGSRLFSLKQLEQWCIETLISHSNEIDNLLIAFENSLLLEIPKLSEHFLSIICENAAQLFTGAKCSTLQAETMLTLVQDQHLKINEINV
jgi:hypothetical protein